MDMMLFSRIRNLRTVLMPVLLVLLTLGCTKDRQDGPPDDPQLAENGTTNRWIIGHMRDVYYWNTSIPRDRELDFRLGPEAFFDGILHPDDQFSWIELADDLLSGNSGISTTVGLGIGLLRIQNDGVVIAVRYVLEGSPAHAAGIKRGDAITAINGREMNMQNYNSVLDDYYGSEPFTVRLGRFVDKGITIDREVELTPVRNFQEKAIHYRSVIETPSQRKVAYLFYNRFLNNQPMELLEAFDYFKSEGAQDLVLDLRYNLGGGIWIAGILSGLIQAGFDEHQPFIQYKYNSNYRDQIVTYYQLFGGDSDDPEDIASANQIVRAIKELNLNLPRVYIIATGSSASASELVINNLRPFLSDANVVHIGDQTVGKNEGSITIVDERTPRQIKWGIQPIVVKLANKAGFGDYPDGLTPHYRINEWNYLPWAPIGSTDDPLLAQALALIDPALQPVAQRTMQMKSTITRALRVSEVPGFVDRHTRPMPVDIGDRGRLNR